MPELPEVETIRQQLTKVLPFKIEKIEYSEHASSIMKKKEFDVQVGDNVFEIKRKGKALQFSFDHKKYLLSHLGMSGGWRCSPFKIKEKHTHLQWTIRHATGHSYLAYVDPRRFGKMYWLREKTLDLQLGKMGPDVSTSDFDQHYLFSIFQKYPHKKIKPFLLDQKYFAGIGNYMACEICALSSIHPERTCGKISKKECLLLKTATKKVIQGSLKYQGLTFSGGYRDTTGGKGKALNNLVVFHQKICGMCKKTDVTKIILNGRGTYFCSACQNE
jgi:formamidopyrimidine-DNA glycosylase